MPTTTTRSLAQELEDTLGRLVDGFPLHPDEADLIERVRRMEEENTALRRQQAQPGPVLTLGPVERQSTDKPHVMWCVDSGCWIPTLAGLHHNPTRRILGLDKVPPPEVKQ